MMNYQEQALAYLRGEMNADERAVFEEELTRSEELRTELQTARSLLDILDEASEHAIIATVNAHVQQAINDRASDIHIVPDGGDGATQILYRMYGQLREAARLPAEQHHALVDRWKVMTGMSLRERHITQQARMVFHAEQGKFDLHVSILPTVAGERVTIGIRDRARELPALDALGMDARTLATVKRLVERPGGCVLLAATTGSARNMFAYALLRHLQTFGAGLTNIMTVEDPVEYRLEGVSQTAVSRRAGLTYPNALRSILCSDPDVVYVGETRDAETAQACFELAASGHLALSSLRVGSAIQTVQQLRDMGMENHLLASNLVGGVGLRPPIRRVCQTCSAPYEPARPSLARAGLSLVEDGPFRRGTGCAECRNTGYKGGVSLFEAWEVTPALRALIADRADMDALWNESFGRTGGSLWDDARAKIRQGVLTVEDAASVLSDHPHPRGDSRAAPSESGLIDLSEF